MFSISAATTKKSPLSRAWSALTARQTLAQVAQEQLIEEQRKLLDAQAAYEYAAAAVRQRRASITRLRRTLEAGELVERGALVAS